MATVRGRGPRLGRRRMRYSFRAWGVGGVVGENCPPKGVSAVNTRAGSGLRPKVGLEDRQVLLSLDGET